MPLGIENNGKAALTKINDLDFFDIKRYQAKSAADSLFGQGLVVSSDNDQIADFLNTTLKKTRFDGLMLQVAEEVSYWGGAILTINKTKTGDFDFSFATPELLQIVENIEITPFAARLMLKKVVGLKVYYVIEEWTTTEVRRSLTIGERGTNREFNPELDKVPAELQKPAYEKHNLGFVPFIEITNKEARNIMKTGFGGWHQLADDYAVRYMATHINYGLRQQFKEKWKGASRIFGDIEASYANKLIEDGTITNFIADDYVIRTDRTQNQNKPIEAVAATYDSAKWSAGWQSEIDLFMIGCGYSPIFGNSSQQTEAETLYSKEPTQRTTKQKRRRYTELLRDLFAKLVVYKGLAADLDEAYELITVEIKENVVYNQLQLVDFLNNAVNFGLMTRSEAIMLQRDIDNKEDAEVILAEIEADQAVRAEQQAKELNMINPEAQADTTAQTGALGTGGDTDPQQEEE